MQLQIGKIFQQAWQITKANKFLWIYGLFLLWGNLFNIGYSLNDHEENYQSFYADHRIVWLQNHKWEAFLILFGIVFVMAVLIYLHFRARAGSIVAIKNILDKKETSFVNSFKEGRLHYRKILFIFIIYNSVIFLLTSLITLPIVYLSSQIAGWQMAILVGLGLLILVPCSIVATFIGIVSPLYAVMFNMTYQDAIRAGFSMITEHWKQLVIFGFFMFCLMILLFVISALIISPFVVLSVLAYHKVSSTFNIALEIASIMAAAGVFLLVQSIVAIFQQAAWILFFRELVKPQKTEEEESMAVMPEVIS